MSDVLALFTSTYSVARSTLTLEEPGKEKAGGPVSVFTLAREAGLDSVTLVETKIDGLMHAVKSADKAKVNLVYGIRFVVCDRMDDKTEGSRQSESKIVVFMAPDDTYEDGNPTAYRDLVRLWNRAATDGFYEYPRLDWNSLNELWTPRLVLALPFFDSVLSQNLLTFSTIVPRFPVTPIVFDEQDTGLPFEGLIRGAVDRYCAESGAERVKTKTILYRDSKAYEAYLTLRCIGQRSSFERPELDHMSSDRFSYESYLALRAKEVA